MSAEPFGARLQAAVAADGPLMAGIDPHASLLRQWGLADDADGMRTMALTVLDAVAGHVCAIKPQSAFFERHGSAGMAVLEELLAAARERGVLSLLDSKRGDIGSTMGAYADSVLAPGAPLEADAVTLSPYLGFGSLAPALALAAEHSKGVFVLALTSNPDGVQVQHAREADGTPVAARIARCAEEENLPAGARAGGHWGHCGLVVGATVGSAARDLGVVAPENTAPLLAPGFGAQGAGPAELADVFGAARERVLVPVSRALLEAGPTSAALSARAAELARACR